MVSFSLHAPIKIHVVDVNAKFLPEPNRSQHHALGFLELWPTRTSVLCKLCSLRYFAIAIENGLRTKLILLKLSPYNFLFELKSTNVILKLQHKKFRNQRKSAQVFKFNTQFLKFNLFIFILCTWMFCLHILYVHYIHAWRPWRPEQSIQSPGTSYRWL